MPNDMLNPPRSYFPPVNPIAAYSSRLPSPSAPAPAPLLPTPISTSLPTTLGGSLSELPPHAVDLKEPVTPPPPCSCPLSDSCIAESLALLLGSFKLLFRVVLKLQDPSAEYPVVEKDTIGLIAAALLRFEACMRRLLAPLLEARGLVMESTLLQQWLRPIQPPTGIEDDVCSSIRTKIDELLIDVVDTFPPIQHNLHMLLVRYEFGHPRFLAVVEALRRQSVDAGTSLLLEAHRHLVQFSVKSDCAYKESLFDDLQSRVDSLVLQVDRHKLEAAMQKQNP